MGLSPKGQRMQDHPIDPERFDFIPQRKLLVQNSVLAMLMFVFAELMFFAGLISAFMIVKTNAVGGIWPPPGQPRLPVGETAFNTCMLLLSGASLIMAHRAWRQKSARLNQYIGGAIALGAFFVVFQGFEWVALIREGLTITSSNHGSFFYLLIGAHALHAVAALVVLVWVFWGSLRGQFNESAFWAAEIFWYFVVGLWPILYGLVYL